MDSRFFQAFVDWYLISIDVLFVLGFLYFFKLPKDKRANSFYWLPFLILTFTFIYENFGAYTNYNFEFKARVNAFLGNTEFPNYNLWLYNIANKQIKTILYLFLIKTWIEPPKKRIINWMIIGFFIVTQIMQFSGIEPIYLNQPIIFAIGANMILVASGLYFMGMMTNEKYLATNPLRLLSFWMMTFMLFTYSLTYIASVSLTYLYANYPTLVISLFQIDLAMGILNKLILIMAIASPKFPHLFEEEPIFDNKESLDIQSSL